MAIATLVMAIATFWLGFQSKRAIEEPKKTEIERAFHRLFNSLRKDILSFDGLFVRYMYGDLKVNDFSDTEKIKETLDLFRNFVSVSFEKIESLSEVLLLPFDLLRRIWAIERIIRFKLHRIGYMADTNKQFNTEIINWIIPLMMLSVRLYQRQLACYFIQEAKNRGYQDIANTMAEVREFKPDRHLQRLDDFLPEHLMPPEPEVYCSCKIENLVAHAKQEAGNSQNEDVYGLIKDA